MFSLLFNSWLNNNNNNKNNPKTTCLFSFCEWMSFSSCFAKFSKLESEKKYSQWKKFHDILYRCGISLFFFLFWFCPDSIMDFSSWWWSSSSLEFKIPYLPCVCAFYSLKKICHYHNIHFFGFFFNTNLPSRIKNMKCDLNGNPVLWWWYENE